MTQKEEHLNQRPLEKPRSLNHFVLHHGASLWSSQSYFWPNLINSLSDPFLTHNSDVGPSYVVFPPMLNATVLVRFFRRICSIPVFPRSASGAVATLRPRPWEAESSAGPHPATQTGAPQRGDRWTSHPGEAQGSDSREKMGEARD